MPYIVLAVSIIFAVINNALYHLIGKGEKHDQYLFTAVSSAVWIVILFPMSGGIRFGIEEIFFGVLYGAVQGAFMFFKMKAMSSGPLSITSVVSICSMMITTILGIVIFDEHVSVLQIIGVCIIVIAVILCVDPKSDMKMTRKWKFYCALFFTFAAGVGIIFKFFSRTDGSGSRMMVVAAFTMMTMWIIASLLSKKDGVSINKRQTVIALLCGVVTCGYNRFNVYLCLHFPSIVFFPTFNGSIVLLSTLIGFIAFKERLSKKQILGCALGLGSIVLISGLVG